MRPNRNEDIMNNEFSPLADDNLSINAKLTFICLVLNDGVPLPDIEEFNNGLEELIQHGYIDDN